MTRATTFVTGGRFVEDRCWVRCLSPAGSGTRAALFLDRDGVVIEERNYLADPDGVALIDGADRAFIAARRLGMAVVIVTNQSGIGRGKFGWSAYRAVEDRMLAALAALGAEPDAVYVCPHHPDGIDDYRRDHPWRKPNPGMIAAAARDLRIDLQGSLMVGDKVSDIDAAERGGLSAAAHVLTGHGTAERAKLNQRGRPGAVSSRHFVTHKIQSVADVPAILQRMAQTASHSQTVTMNDNG